MTIETVAHLIAATQQYAATRPDFAAFAALSTAEAEQVLLKGQPTTLMGAKRVASRYCRMVTIETANGERVQVEALLASDAAFQAQLKAYDEMIKWDRVR